MARAVAGSRPERGNRVFLVLAVVAAFVAAVLVFAALSGGGGGADTVATSKVVVAGQAIPANTRITAEMLELQFLPTEEVNTEAFTAPSQVINRVTTEDVAAGQQIAPTSVSRSAGEGVSFVVQPGQRAISVEVGEVVTAGGNLEPGDYVDIIGIFQVADVVAANHLLSVLGLPYQVTDPPRPATPEGTTSGGLVLTVSLLQNVKLLALAQSLAADSAGGAADNPSDTKSNPSAATTTLELTPQQAQEITWSDEFGILRMDGRAVGDHEVVEVLPTLLRLGSSR